MRMGLGLTVALFFACATAYTLSGQQPASPTPSTDATTTQSQKSEMEPKPQVSTEDTVGTFKLRVNLVQVHVVVRDSAGKPVENLHNSDRQTEIRSSGAAWLLCSEKSGRSAGSGKAGNARRGLFEGRDF